MSPAAVIAAKGKPEEQTRFLGASFDKNKNIAGDDGVDGRILSYATERISEFSERVIGLHQRWCVTHHMLSGNTIDKAGPLDVHMPELYKALETMVPRLEEAILEKDPWFRCRPRREQEDGKANATAAMLEWQLSQMKQRRLVQPGLRDMLVHQVGVQKYWWDHVVEERETRHVSVTGGETGKPVYRVSFPKEKQLIYSGPRTRLVDPFDFIIDPRATDPQDAAYVGDRCYLSLDQLEHFQRIGFIKNVDKLRNIKTRGSLFPPEMDYFKWSRSPLTTYGFNGLDTYTRNSGQPTQFEVVELWGKFDIKGTGEYEEAVITIANGSVVLRAMPNPYFYKFRPYSTARAARNGHDFFGTGPLDNAVRLNQHLDRYHAIFLRASEIAGCPMVFVEDDSELPDTLWKVRPFSIFKAAGRVTMTTVPDGVLRAGPELFRHLSRQIEEVTGAFKIEMGQQVTGGTATEASLALQEGNRRMRGHVRGYTDALDQQLRIMHWMNLQFMTDKVAFRVIGKRAQEIGEQYLSIGPDTMLEDVDFEFVGLSDLHTYGMRGPLMVQAMAQAGPIVMANPNRVDQVGILHMLIENAVGQADADRFIRVSGDRRTRMTQPEENIQLVQGTTIHADPDDPHDKHIEDMADTVRRAMAGELEEHATTATLSHFAEHMAFREAQQEQEMVQQREAAQRVAIQAPEAGGIQGPAGASPQAGGMSAAMQKPGQRSQENPGPLDGAKVGAFGRANQSTPQSTNGY